MSSSYKVYWKFNSDEFLNGEFEFFSYIYAIYSQDFDFNTNNINALENTTKRSLNNYNVERRSIDEIFVTYKYVPSDPKPYGLVFVSALNGERKIVLTCQFYDTEIINYSYEHIVSFKLPFKYLDISHTIKLYPNISLYSNKSTYAPIGEELVTIGEHHHGSKVLNTQGANDIVSTTERDLISAYNGKVKSLNKTSYVAGETSDENGYDQDNTSNLTGYKNTTNPEEIIQDPSIDYDRTTNNFDLLANIFEEIISSDNSVQLLGHELPEADLSTLNNDELINQANILTVNNLTKTSNRDLGVITPIEFRKWMFSYINVNSSNPSVSTETVTTQVNTTTSFTLTFNKHSQIAYIKYDVAKHGANSTAVFIHKPTGNSISLVMLPQYSYKVFVDENGNFSIDDNSILERLYPIGSYYLTNRATNPAYLFGGTWERAPVGRFIRNAALTDVLFNNGSRVDITGGSQTVTLSASQIWSHYHTAYHCHTWTRFYDNGGPEHSNRMRDSWRTDKYGDGGWNPGQGYMFRAKKSGEGGSNHGFMGYDTSYVVNTLTSASAGNSYAHNNVPPYLSIYCWRRIA